MKSYRITKFNPEKRNEKGHYLDASEWTSISDTGKPKYRNVTYEEYERIESAYVEAVKLIMQDNQLSFLKVDSLGFRDKKIEFKKHETSGRLRNIDVDFDKEVKTLKDGLQLDIPKVEKIIRLILRETVWMLLINENFEVRFGYDYYMYVTCRILKPSTKQRIEESGLFVE